MAFGDIEARLSAVRGQVSCWYENMVTGEAFAFEADRPLVAASVIKLALLGAVYERFESGALDPSRRVPLCEGDRTPGSGVLGLLDAGLEPTLRDLCAMMVTLSDNTATNMLFDLVGGSTAINGFLKTRGLDALSFNRKMYDGASGRLGVQNRITARGVGALLKALYRGELVSPRADAAMLDLMKNQQINHKLPFYLSLLEIAHKTGEDDGTSHDVGIVYAPQPFVLCLLSNDVDVPAFERLMQEIARDLARRCGA